jgi:hypothetical protein
MVKQERNSIYTLKRRKDNWIGHIVRGKGLVKHFIEEKMEERGR